MKMLSVPMRRMATAEARVSTSTNGQASRIPARRRCSNGVQLTAIIAEHAAPTTIAGVRARPTPPAATASTGVSHKNIAAASAFRMRYGGNLEPGGGLTRPPREKSARAWRADEPVSVDHDLPIADHVRRRPLHGAPLVGVVVHLHVQRLHAQRGLAVRVEDDDVGIAADGDRALARKEAEHLRRR